MNKLIIYFFLALALSLSSCFKEKPIKAPTNNIGTLFTANMGADYSKQLYFNVQNGLFIDSNSRYDYDLAFDCDANKFNIWLNGAKLMQAARTGKTGMNEVKPEDTLSLEWRVEFGYGLADSNAIGKWGNYPQSDKKVYVLNLGTDESGNGFGYKKMQVGDFNGGYQITFANLDGSEESSAFIPKNSDVNFTYYSFATKSIKNLEPAKDIWDLQFTEYSTYFYKEKLPYKVTGVLTNPYKTNAYLMDSTSDFTTIKLANVDNSKFNEKRDGIGYEWKQYEFGSYMVKTGYNYIIKSDEKYFKLRMLDFYDSNGNKGFPKFEYEELK